MEHELSEHDLKNALWGLEFMYKYSLMDEDKTETFDTAGDKAEAFIAAFKQHNEHRQNYGLTHEQIQIATAYGRTVFLENFTNVGAHIFALLRVQIYGDTGESCQKTVDAGKIFFNFPGVCPKASWKYNEHIEHLPKVRYNY